MTDVILLFVGVSGLAVLKNLKDEGFNVQVFERRSNVGGLWQYSDDPVVTSVVPSETNFILNRDGH